MIYPRISILDKKGYFCEEDRMGEDSITAYFRRIPITNSQLKLMNLEAKIMRIPIVGKIYSVLGEINGKR